jgi:hypothetical protein
MPRVRCAFIAARAESIDRFRPALPKSRLKRGHLNEEEI